MGYIGRGPVKSGAFRIIDDIASSFNGSTTGFTLQHNSSNLTPGTEQNLLIAVDGVMQEPIDAFTISSSTITFTSAPASGASFWGVELGDVGGIAQTIANGAVDTSQLVADSVDGTKIADESINSEHYVDGSIDTVHIDALQVTGAKIANDTITEGKLDVSNGPTNDYFLQAQSGEGGGLTWAAASSALSTKRVYTSYIQGTTSDPQTISGAGFQPTKVEIIASTGGTSGGSSIGHSDSSNSEFCTSLQSNGYYGARDGKIVHISNGSWSLSCTCTINSDGCVLDWTAEVSGWATIYLSVMFSR